MTTNQRSVLDPRTAEYVLPQPPRPTGEVVVVAQRRDQANAWRRGSEVARCLGDRFLALAETQQLFAEELRERLNALDNAVADGSRAQWKGAVRDVVAVLDWGDAVQLDILEEARMASTGAEPIGVEDLCHEVAAHLQTTDQPIFVRGHTNAAWWGSAPALADLVVQALGLLAERTQGVGAREIDVSEVPGSIRLAFAVAGEPGDGVEPDSIVRFRRAVDQVHAAVKPDALGPGSTGFSVELPKPPLPSS